MSASTVDDPIRADVERYLHVAVEMAIALPLAATLRAQRCARTQLARAGERLVAPLRLAQSLIDAAGVRAVVAPVDDHVPTPVPAAVVMPRRASATGGRRTTTVTPPSTPSAGVDDLPIEEYESLAASHVVARLQQLTPDELRRLRDFEAANRGRRTVLGKIEQLLG